MQVKIDALPKKERSFNPLLKADRFIVKNAIERVSHEGEPIIEVKLQRDALNFLISIWFFFNKGSSHGFFESFLNSIGLEYPDHGIVDLEELINKEGYAAFTYKDRVREGVKKARFIVVDRFIPKDNIK